MKLKAAGAPSNFIETVYGIGYRLKPQEEEKKRGGDGEKKRQEEKREIQSSQDSSSQTLLAVAGIWEKYKISKISVKLS